MIKVLKQGLYRESQIGYVMMAAIGTALATVFYLIYIIGFNIVFFLIIIFLGFFFALLSNMNVEVDTTHLTIRLGGGLVTKKIRLVDIVSYAVHKTPLHNEWGIRPLQKGWIFSIHGFKSIEIELKNGEKYLIGSQKPERLVKALNKFAQNKIKVS